MTRRSRPHTPEYFTLDRWPVRLALLLISAGLLLTGCGGEHSVVNPSGPRAETTATIWWISFALGSLIFVLVVALLVYALLKRRPEADPDLPGGRDGTRFILSLGVGLPVIILAGVFGYTALALDSLEEPDEPVATTIEVIGHQWWWEVRYPNEGFVTANEIHIPVGQPVMLEVTTDDVIHSFWAPELSGKIDLLPGQTNEVWIEADEAGVYRGQCAEFCGIQHANMAFHIVADPPDEYAAWVANQQQPSVPAQDTGTTMGQQVFLGSSCVYCHTIEGTGASGKVGPDLTHLMSREWIAAGTLPNGRGGLGGWIANPQHAKPGNFMPSTTLSGDEFNALLSYLVTLE